MKRTLLVLVMALSLLLGIIPALAVPPADLNALGRYFPADTPIFVSMRIDDDFIETLDGLLDRLRTAFPDDIPPTSLREMLDEGIRETNPEGTFQSEVRSWLGDTASFGLTSFELLADDDSSNDDEAPFYFAISITDRAAAVEFFEGIIPEDNVARTDEADYTLLVDTQADSEAGIYINDEVLLFTNTRDMLPHRAPLTTSLRDNSAFNDALALLPETDYNATLYLDLAALLQAAAANDPEAAEAMDMFGPLLGGLGPQVMGFTILNDTSLTIDMAQSVGDLSALMGQGFSMPALSPISPDFARRVPANAPLMIQGTDLNAYFNANLNNTLAALRQQAETTGEMSVEEVEENIAEMEQAFTAFTGLDLRDDLLAWMTGDYALFLTLNPNLAQFVSMPTEMPVEVGFAVAVTDPDAAQNTVTGLTRTLNQLSALISAGGQDNPNAPTSGVTSERIGGAAVSVLTIKTPEVRFPVELLLGANDEVFALGTRSAVTAILTGDGGLAANPAYRAAQALVVPDAINLAWLNMDGLTPILDIVTMFARPDESAQVRALFNLIDSGIITSAIDENGQNRVRLVLILSE